MSEYLIRFERNQATLVKDGATTLKTLTYSPNAGFVKTILKAIYDAAVDEVIQGDIIVIEIEEDFPL